ncbi:MAG: spermidine/putrescine transporter ATP-binding subunit [Proteobacteria bacterium]|nr:spermidine/putrescine transporter ATP-binding subunit [Pseudomonadota bacterium]
MALLELRNITKRFGNLDAVKEVTLDIETGEFFTLLGPSGCGKTTILRMIAGFDAPDEGELFLEGKSLAGISPEQRPVHTVFQSYALFPHLTVVGNIAFPLEMAGLPISDIRLRVKETLELVHLEDKGGAYPHELSGGQKQRVALARGLVNKPRLLLLDEPLGALDAKLRERMQVELVALQREVGITFVFVTHAQQEALALSHRIAVMNAGRVEQVDVPEVLYSSPKNRFVADFIGNINLIDCFVVDSNHHGLRLNAQGLGEIAAPAQTEMGIGRHGVLALRPEYLRVGPANVPPTLKNHFLGMVSEYLFLGDETVYKILLDNGMTLEALVANAAPGRARFHEIGDRVLVEWRHDAGVFLLA